jgi:hypothetical protein
MVDDSPLIIMSASWAVMVRFRTASRTLAFDSSSHTWALYGARAHATAAALVTTVTNTMMPIATYELKPA